MHDASQSLNSNTENIPSRWEIDLTVISSDENMSLRCEKNSAPIRWCYILAGKKEFVHGHAALHLPWHQTVQTVLGHNRSVLKFSNDGFCFIHWLPKTRFGGQVSIPNPKSTQTLTHSHHLSLIRR